MPSTHGQNVVSGWARTVTAPGRRRDRRGLGDRDARLRDVGRRAFAQERGEDTVDRGEVLRIRLDQGLGEVRPTSIDERLAPDRLDASGIERVADLGQLVDQTGVAGGSIVAQAIEGLVELVRAVTDEVAEQVSASLPVVLEAGDLTASDRFDAGVAEQPREGVAPLHRIVVGQGRCAEPCSDDFAGQPGWIIGAVRYGRVHVEIDHCHPRYRADASVPSVCDPCGEMNAEVATLRVRAPRTVTPRDLVG